MSTTNTQSAAAALEPLLDQLAELLAAALAPRLAAELARQATPANPAPTRRLLSLDELVAQLPTAKTAKTRKRPQAGQAGLDGARLHRQTPLRLVRDPLLGRDRPPPLRDDRQLPPRRR